MNNTTTNEGMNLISLEVMDFKRIGAAYVSFNDGATIITGANGAGKSSLIDSIFYALTGSGVDKPVRSDCYKCSIKLRIGGQDCEYLIERTVTPSGKYITVKNGDGKPIPAPQTFLNGLFVEMADPLVFMDMKPRDQCDALRIACNCDTRSIEAEIKQSYNERTIVNRRLTQAEAALKEFGDEPEKVAPKSATELINKSEELESVIKAMDGRFEIGKKYNAEIDEIVRDIKILDSDEGIILAEIEKLQARLDSIKSERDTARDQISYIEGNKSKLKAECAEAMPAFNKAKAALETVKNEIRGIDEHNRKANEYEAWCRQHLALSDNRNTAHKESYELTQKIESLEADKQTLLMAADYPVLNMLIEGDSVYVDGVPFADLNTAEQIKVATFVAIAQNPKLKMIIIRHGSMLDANSMQIVSGIAKQRGYQILVEKVSEQPEADSLHIVEGQITQQ